MNKDMKGSPADTMTGSTESTGGHPQIIAVEAEQEILYQRACAGVRAGLRAVRQELAVAEATDMIAAMAVTGVLDVLRGLSARQLAVLLAREADHRAARVIHEPPRYTAGEIADVT